MANERLAEATERVKGGLSARELARIAGIDHTVITRMLQGGGVSAETVRRFVANINRKLGKELNLRDWLEMAGYAYQEEDLSMMDDSAVNARFDELLRSGDLVLRHPNPRKLSMQTKREIIHLIEEAFGNQA